MLLTLGKLLNPTPENALVATLGQYAEARICLSEKEFIIQWLEYSPAVMLTSHGDKAKQGDKILAKCIILIIYNTGIFLDFFVKVLPTFHLSLWPLWAFRKLEIVKSLNA